MGHPYQSLPPAKFWKSFVANGLSDIYEKRFEIEPGMRITTAGSCFAQHIAVNLRRNGYQVLDVEPPPPSTPEDLARKYGYSIYSARYANIYTARQLLQLAREATEGVTLAEPIWQRQTRFYDAFRPTVEPTGLASPELVTAHRASHLKKVAGLLAQTDLFIFTFGLTEGWIHRSDGTVYPTAPGVHASSFDIKRHAFVNYSVDEVVADFTQFMALAKRVRPTMKFLLTVSPVPLAATASGTHVLPATIRSKSILRAAVGELYDAHPDVDYFPSYEMIGTPFSGNILFEPDLRSVSAKGVEQVMDVFFAAHGAVAQAPAPAVQADTVCEEEILQAFAR